MEVGKVGKRKGEAGEVFTSSISVHDKLIKIKFVTCKPRTG